MYSINILNNEGVCYHIKIDPKYVLGSNDFKEINDDMVVKIITKLGFNPAEVYYEVVPDEQLTVLNYVFDPDIPGYLQIQQIIKCNNEISHLEL